MNKILIILLLITLTNCSTVKTNEESKPSINSVIEGFKGMQLPKLTIDMPF